MLHQRLQEFVQLGTEEIGETGVQRLLGRSQKRFDLLMLHLHDRGRPHIRQLSALLLEARKNLGLLEVDVLEEPGLRGLKDFLHLLKLLPGETTGFRQEALDQNINLIVIFHQDLIESWGLLLIHSTLVSSGPLFFGDSTPEILDISQVSRRFQVSHGVPMPDLLLGKTLLEATSPEFSQLQSCPICSGLGSDALGSIAEIAKERRLEKGQFLAHEGEVCSGFYLILSGKLRVFKTAPNGKERVLLIASRGMTFGENALFGQGFFLENACALDSVRALHIPRKEFLDMLRKNPDLAFQVMESLCMWIRRLSSSVESIAFMGAHDKVIRYFLDLVEPRPGAAPNRALVSLPDKKRTVADQLGITPETFSRVLRKLEAKSLIQVDKRKVSLTDLSGLRDALAD